MILSHSKLTQTLPLGNSTAQNKPIKTPRASRARVGVPVQAQLPKHAYNDKEPRQHAAVAGAAAALLLLSSPQLAHAMNASEARQTTGQGDLLVELMEKNAGNGTRSLGAQSQNRYQQIVSDAGSPASSLGDSGNSADSQVDKVKNLGKRAQQTTPHGSPTKPQPAQRAGPLEALKAVPKPQLQVASAESSFKLEGPISRGTQGIDFPDPKQAKESVQAKKNQFFQSTPKPPSQAEAGQAAKATADKVADAAPSDNSFLKSLLSKPQQAASSSAQQAKEASKEAADSAKDAAPSGNPLTKLFSKPKQATEAAKEAAPSSNPLNSLFTKPKQAAETAASKSKQASKAADDATPSSNPFSGLLSKPKQVADKSKGKAEEAAAGAAAAGGAAAAAAASNEAASNAVKSALPSNAPSLPTPPSIPNPAEALRSTNNAASKLSLPEAPSLPSIGQDSTAVQQAVGLAAAEAVAALVASNLVGSLTKQSRSRRA